VLPIALDAETAELAALNIDPAFGKLAAFAAELDDRTASLSLALGAILLLDLPFDRQAMAVPARNVRRILAEHLLERFTTSLRILFSAWPIWMAPLA
jgi:hypothetical protein